MDKVYVYGKLSLKEKKAVKKYLKVHELKKTSSMNKPVKYLLLGKIEQNMLSLHPIKLKLILINNPQIIVIRLSELDQIE